MEQYWAFKTKSISETYVTILKDMYKGATAKVHVSNEVLEEILALRDKRQGDPISPNWITATIQTVFKNVEKERNEILMEKSCQT